MNNIISFTKKALMRIVAINDERCDKKKWRKRDWSLVVYCESYWLDFYFDKKNHAFNTSSLPLISGDSR